MNPQDHFSVPKPFCKLKTKSKLFGLFSNLYCPICKIRIIIISENFAEKHDKDELNRALMELGAKDCFEIDCPGIFWPKEGNTCCNASIDKKDGRHENCMECQTCHYGTTTCADYQDWKRKNNMAQVMKSRLPP